MLIQIKVAFDKACKSAFTEFALNEELRKQIPVNEIELEIGKIIKFYKIYENVNRKLIECISENSEINKELTNTINNLNEEKKKVDDSIHVILRRLKESSQKFEELNKEFAGVISYDMKGYLTHAQKTRENLIK